MFVEHFPGNYPWSFTTMGALGTCAWGGGEVGEIYEVMHALREHIGDTDKWFEAWNSAGQKADRKGQAADEAGRFATARACYFRANRYYQMADRMMPHTDARKLIAYRNSLRCFHRAAVLMDPPMEVVEVPYESSSFPAYFVHPSPRLGARGPAPAVVLFDGLDGTSEVTYFFIGRALAERGFAVLVCDGPGNGAALRLRQMPSRYDYEVAGSAAFEYLLGRTEVNPNRIGIMAMSMGGYYAPRAAAMEPRYKACVAWGGSYDLHSLWEKRFREGTKRGAGPASQIMWVLGVESWEAVLEKLKPFALADVLPRLTCPFLVVHGADDAQTPKEIAIQAYERAGSEDKSLVLLTEEEGGNQHCQMDNISAAHYHILDWLEQRLAR